MWKYYGLLVIAVVLFSVQFVFTKLYQKQRGNGFAVAMISNIIVCIGTIPFFLFLNGGKVEFKGFSLLLSSAFALCGILCSFAGLKVLAAANLSVYSMFLMLGGMLIPLVYGMFVGEKLTLLKAGAILLVIAALALTLKKEKKAKRISVYVIIGYLVIFLTNGLVSVWTFVHQKSQFDTVSAPGFLLLAEMVRLSVSSIMLGGYAIYRYINNKSSKTDPAAVATITVDKKTLLISWLLSIVVMLGYAMVNGTAQLLTTYTAAHLEAGVQSTIVTGGCIFLSAVMGLFFREKITQKTIFSLLLALSGAVLIMF
ncbi:MAG: hypothetical protein E7364_04495 [Clostridiales bacterium]|nr:hypothetical protein [Clostridiales bacterium]